MKRDEEKVREALRLREMGLSDPKIAARLGVTAPTVWKWRNPDRALELSRRDSSRPERKAAKSKWLREASQDPKYMVPCVDCGRPTGSVTWSSRAKAGPIRCSACWAVLHEARWARIEALWAQGLKLREIAAELGTTTESIGVTINNMRKAGRDVPHRYRRKADTSMSEVIRRTSEAVKNGPLDTRRAHDRSEQAA